MHRRRFLSVAVGALTGVAGCSSDGDPSTVRAPTTVEPTTASPTPTTEHAPRLAVSIETSRYLVRSSAQDQEQRAIQPDDITPLGDIADPLRSALETAVEGGLETDEVSEELLAGIDRFRHHGGGYSFDPYFSVNGTPYAFEARVPLFVAELDLDVEAPDPDRTVTQDDLDGLAEPAADFVRTLGAYGTMVARDEYRVSVVPSSVEALLEHYDYLRDPGGVGRIVTERVDPGPPYTIHADELTAEEIWGRPVLRADALPGDLRRFVRTVVTSDRRALVYPASRTEYRTDELPAGYDAHLGPDRGPGSGPYVEQGGTMYAFRVTEVRREHVPLGVAVASAGPDAFELTVAPSEAGPKPAVDGPVAVASTWSMPGPLWVHAGEDRHRLDLVEAVIRGPDDEARFVENAETASIPVGGALSATYRVPPAVPPGTYRAWGLVRVDWVAAESGRPSPTWPFPFQVVLTVPGA